MVSLKLEENLENVEERLVYLLAADYTTLKHRRQSTVSLF